MVDFEKCCKTHIFLQKSEPIQPKTSNILPKFCQPTACGAGAEAEGAERPPRGARLPRPPQGGLRRARRRPRARQWLSFLGYLIRKLRLGSGEGSTNQPTLFSIHFCATSVKMFRNNCWNLDKYSSRLSPGRAIPLQRYSRRTGGTRTLWCFCISSTAKYPCRRFTSLGLAFLSCCG